MDTLDEQKIIALLSTGDLNNKKLAFQLIESLKLDFNWDKYIALDEWLKEDFIPFIGGDYDKKSDFSTREEAVISVFLETNRKRTSKNLGRSNLFAPQFKSTRF